MKRGLSLLLVLCMLMSLLALPVLAADVVSPPDAESGIFYVDKAQCLSDSTRSYINSRNMQYVSWVATRELGFEKFDYHSLRHTHATMLAELGASPKYVQHRLGHKNIQVTMNIYQHLTDKMSEEGAKLLDTL